MRCAEASAVEVVVLLRVHGILGKDGVLPEADALKVASRLRRFRASHGEPDSEELAVLVDPSKSTNIGVGRRVTYRVRGARPRSGPLQMLARPEGMSRQVHRRLYREACRIAGVDHRGYGRGRPSDKAERRRERRAVNRALEA